MGLTDYSRMDKEFFESGVRAEREFIINMLGNRLFWLINLDKLAEAEELRTQIAILKEKK